MRKIPFCCIWLFSLCLLAGSGEAAIIRIDSSYPTDPALQPDGSYKVFSILKVDDILSTITGFNQAPFGPDGNNLVVFENTTTHTFVMATELVVAGVGPELGLIDLASGNGGRLTWEAGGPGLTIQGSSSGTTTIDWSNIPPDSQWVPGSGQNLIRYWKMNPTNDLVVKDIHFLNTTPYPDFGGGQAAMIRMDDMISPGTPLPKFQNCVFDIKFPLLRVGPGQPTDTTDPNTIDHCAFRLIESDADPQVRYLVGFNYLWAKHTGTMSFSHCSFIGDSDVDWSVLQGNDYLKPNYTFTDCLFYNIKGTNGNVASPPNALTHILAFPSLLQPVNENAPPPDNEVATPSSDSLIDVDPRLVNPLATIDDTAAFAILQANSPARDLNNPANNIGYDVSAGPGLPPAATRHWVLY